MIAVAAPAAAGRARARPWPTARAAERVYTSGANASHAIVLGKKSSAPSPKAVAAQGPQSTALTAAGQAWARPWSTALKSSGTDTGQIATFVGLDTSGSPHNQCPTLVSTGSWGPACARVCLWVRVPGPARVTSNSARVHVYTPGPVRVTSNGTRVHVARHARVTRTGACAYSGPMRVTSNGVCWCVCYGARASYQ